MVEKAALLLSVIVLAHSASSLCPAQCRCDDERLTADCAVANLSVVPIFLNPAITKLDASVNRIHKLEGALAFYTALETLDLSANEFRHLGKRQFEGLSKLQTLNVSGNAITALHAGAFYGPSTLQTLDLSRNALFNLEDGIFEGLHSLVELRLDDNSIEKVSAGAFRGLSSLRVLHMERNAVATLSDWLAPLENLRFVYAAENALTSLQDGIFKSQSALKVITLGSNRISEIGQDAFKGLRSVDTLDMSRNELRSVPSMALSNLPQLSHLDLSGNPVTRLDRGSFRNMHALRVLHLNAMPRLENVEQHAFVDATKLSQLRLEANPQLRPLPWGVFDANAALETLSVRNNTWNSLSPMQLPRHGALQSLFLSGLPLHCNCSVIWLWEIYQQGENSTLFVDEVRCASLSGSTAGSSGVGGNAGDPLSVMAVDQLACADWTSVLFAISVAIIVTVLVLAAVAFAIYRYRMHSSEKRYGAPCLHIKDDTMIYKSSLFSSGGMSVDMVGKGGCEPTYRAVSSSGGYSPTMPSDTADATTLLMAPASEPFYEVPKYANADEVFGAKPTSMMPQKAPSCDDSMMHGYMAPSWDHPAPSAFSPPIQPRSHPRLPLLQQQHHRYATSMSLTGSPQSTTTMMTTAGDSSGPATATNSSTSSSKSSTSCGSAGNLATGSSANLVSRPMFYSPTRVPHPPIQPQQHHFNNGFGGSSNTLIHFSPLRHGQPALHTQPHQQRSFDDAKFLTSRPESKSNRPHKRRHHQNAHLFSSEVSSPTEVYLRSSGQQHRAGGHNNRPMMDAETARTLIALQGEGRRRLAAIASNSMDSSGDRFSSSLDLYV